MAVVNEGGARISQSKGVFYNPRMRTLRDISVLFLKAISAEGSLLDSTSATGVRGIRYAKEAGFRDIVFLDINKGAARNANLNIKRNGLGFKCLNESVQAYCSGELRHRFDVIDLDPFGTPVPYINDLLKVSKDRTILMVTATDTAVLCGAHANACLKLYGSKPMHNELCKESGIRILLNFVIRSAAQFNFGAEVLLSISDMHYMRVFVRLHAGAKKAAESLKQSGFATFCSKCRSFSFARGIAPFLGRKCAICGANAEAFGPMYLGSLKDSGIVEKMLHDCRMSITAPDADAYALLSRISGELETPFFYSIPRITGLLHMSSVPMDGIMDRLKRHGFSVSRTHFDKDGIKTTASGAEVLRVVKGLRNDVGASH